MDFIEALLNNNVDLLGSPLTLSRRDIKVLTSACTKSYQIARMKFLQEYFISTTLYCLNRHLGV